MAIHENLTRIPKPRLREVGISKAAEMAKVARRDGKTFDSADLVAQSQGAAARRVQSAGGTPSDGEGNRTLGADLFQAVQKSAAGDRAGTRNSLINAGKRKIARLLLEMICADFLAGVHMHEDRD